MRYSEEIKCRMEAQDALRQKIEANGWESPLRHNRHEYDLERRELWLVLLKEESDLWREEKELRAQAAKEFARLNGWKHSAADFSIEMLSEGRPRRKWGEYFEGDRDLFDHPVFFRENQKPYRPAALVGQPYGMKSVCAEPLIIERRSMRWDGDCYEATVLKLDRHVPPKVKASWWYPGSTAFVCVTRPGTPVQWLPDQI
jgi:hypothetical protein